MIKPFGNQILLEPFEEKQVLVQETPSLSCYGKVLDVGENVYKIKVGDNVAFLLWGVNHVEIEGKKYYFCQELPEFILGIIHE